MPTPSEGEEMIRDTRAAIEQVEKALADDPRSPSLTLTRDSLAKRLRALEAQSVDGDRPLTPVGSACS